MLFFGTLHSDGFIFHFLLCFLLPFFSQLFVRPPRTAVFLFAFLFLGDGLNCCLLFNVMNFHPLFFDLLLLLFVCVCVCVCVLNIKGSSFHFQGKPFHSTRIQVYVLSSNAEVKVEWLYEDLQDSLELAPKKDILFIIVDWNAKVGSQEITWSNRQIWLWSTE